MLCSFNTVKRNACNISLYVEIRASAQSWKGEQKKKIANNRNLNLLAEVALGFRNYFAILQFDDRISLEIRLMLIRNLIKTDEIYLIVTKIRLIRSSVKRQ